MIGAGVAVSGTNAVVGWDGYNPAEWREHDAVDEVEGDVPEDVLMVLGLTANDLGAG